MTADRGAAAAVLLAVTAVVMILGLGLGVVAAVWDARARAAAAADAAALAAAPVTFRAFGARGGPAAEASRFAAANGARLTACACPVDRSWAPRTVTVTVVRTADIPGVGAVQVPASASAEFRPLDLIQG